MNASSAQPFRSLLPYVGLGMVLLVASYLRWQFLDVPFERDEGEYCYQAQLLLEGKIPYLDFYEQKPPGLFYSYALLQAIFGNTLQGVHLGFLWINLFSILLIFQFCKNLFDPWAALAASGSFTLLSLNKMAAGFSAQAEHLLVFYFLAGLCGLQMALRHKNQWWWVLGATLLSWAVLIKQNGIFFLALACCFVGLTYYRQGNFSFKRFGKIITWMLLGFMLPVVVVIFYLYLQGAWSEMLFWIVEYPQSYIGQYHWATGWRRFSKNFRRISETYELFWLLAAVALLLLPFVRKVQLPKLWFYLFAFFSLLAIVPGFRFYGHYFLLLFPALAIGCGLAFYLIRFGLADTYYPALPLGVFTLVFLFSFYQQSGYYFETNATELLRSVYQTNPFQETKIISDYLREHSQEGDQIAVWGSEPQINFYTQRSSPTKHNFLLFLMGNTPQTALWQQELIAETSAAAPRYIVAIQHPYSGAINAKNLSIFYPWSRAYLAKHYETIGLIEIFKDRASKVYWEAAARRNEINSPYQVLLYERKVEK